jgi:hypothetical protein
MCRFRVMHVVCWCGRWTRSPAVSLRSACSCWAQQLTCVLSSTTQHRAVTQSKDRAWWLSGPAGGTPREFAWASLSTEPSTSTCKASEFKAATTTTKALPLSIRQPSSLSTDAGIKTQLSLKSSDMYIHIGTSENLLLHIENPRIFFKLRKIS